VVTALRESSESVSSSSWRLKGGAEGAIGMATSELLLTRRRTRARFLSDFGCKKRRTGDGDGGSQ